MKKYKVSVNGVAYEIELEEITGEAADPSVSAAVPAAVTAPTIPPAATQAAGENVTAPMPGTILSVGIVTGAAVKKGQVLMILEAMKMENEIMCPRDGKVLSVHTTQGATVESGTLLCVIQ